MIRREDIARDIVAPGLPTVTGARKVAVLARAGESVRITGLGTLARHPSFAEVPAGGVGASYRLTLTAAVAKACAARVSAGASHALAHDVESDVRHLARALGAPVEVWAPATGEVGSTRREAGAKHITTVEHSWSYGPGLTSVETDS